ncbi:hypothetical protein [Thermus sp.]|uniref:hypothetical protein n=1 Tax=Thermus sp. TaxID=275 RepID=UPI00307E95C4
MRSLVLLLLVALGVYWYAENRGLAVGYPPFLPVVYWKYTGEARYPVRVTGLLDAVKVRVEGELREGRLAVAFLREGRVVGEERFEGAFRRELRFPAPPGAYELRFRLEGAKGLVRYDWVATKFAP